MHCMHNETMYARTGVRVYVPSSSGPAPVGAPYQVALAASQLGSAVKSEAVKLTAGLAHEPYVTRREKTSAPSASTLEEDAIAASRVTRKGVASLADRRSSAFR